jgi:type II secretory pathway predicted ATPase ExeA
MSWHDMAAYLKFHQLQRMPFEGADSNRLVLATESLRRAYAEIKSGLAENSPRICLSGGPGIGKSSLARALPKLLSDDARCVLIRDPSRDWSHIKATIAKQLGLEAGQLSRASLTTARKEGRRIVLVIDQAEKLPAESLEHLDVVLGYRDDDGEQLAQCVLLANLEAAPRGEDVPLLWWLDKLTTRQLTFSPIPEDGLRSYIEKHLKKAGAAGASIFDDEAIVAIHRFTGGVPGAVSALCEELLDRAAAVRAHTIPATLVSQVFGEELDETPGPELERAEQAATPGEGSFQETTAEMAQGTAQEEAENGAEDELPQFGGRMDALSLEMLSPDGLGVPEPELDIQQGLLPIEDSNNYSDDSDFFAAAGPDHDAPVRPSPPPYIPRSSPGSGRGARTIRNLIGLAVVSVIAVLVHAWWNETSPATPVVLRKAPAQPIAREAPTEALAVSPTLPADDQELLALRPEAKEASNDAEGLTPDLKLDKAANDAVLHGVSKNEADGAESPEASEAPSLSLDELYDLAEKFKAEPQVFEPWSQQAPETAPAAPAPKQ